MVRRVTKQPRVASGLRGNRFHRCHHSRLELVQAASQLDSLLAKAPEEGFRERPLLEWFGAATERMALLAHAGGHVYPTHVAKELILNNMRADFAVLSEKFSMDPISVERLHFWAKTLRLGAHFQIRRFDDVAIDAQNWIQQALWVGPTIEGARPGIEHLPSIERGLPAARDRASLSLR